MSTLQSTGISPLGFDNSDYNELETDNKESNDSKISKDETASPKQTAQSSTSLVLTLYQPLFSSIFQSLALAAKLQKQSPIGRVFDTASKKIENNLRIRPYTLPTFKPFSIMIQPKAGKFYYKMPDFNNSPPLPSQQKEISPKHLPPFLPENTPSQSEYLPPEGGYSTRRHKKRVKILSLDGGGVRGAVSARIMTKISSAISKVHGVSREGVGEQFEGIAGTSIGGFLACGYGALKNPYYPELGNSYKADDAIQLFKREAIKIFPDQGKDFLSKVMSVCSHAMYPKHNSSGIEGALERVFQDRTFGESNTKLMLTAYDIKRAEPYILESDNPLHRNLKMSDVSRATTAAPTYFSPKVMSIGNNEYSFIDGGIAFPNPSLRAYSWAQSRFDYEEMVVCSIGTGEASHTFESHEGDWGFLGWLPTLPNCYTTASVKGAHNTMESLSNHNSNLHYFRFDPTLHKELNALDNACPINMQKLEEVADAYMDEDCFEESLRTMTNLFDVD
jgi:uncharacterized protein